MALPALPAVCWSRSLSAEDPPARVHAFSRPPVLEALKLLPVAARVGSYIYAERLAGREPIFDLNGIMLEPPTPGPFAGVPLGGIGAGCIGRGYRGEMRRWSIHAGRYIHREVLTNQFSIRVKRGGDVRCVVLSVMDGAGADPLLRGWAWGVPAERVESHALFPRSWLVFRDALPGLTVIIEQISPVIPNCYSDTSLPTAVFDVSVDNTDPFTEAEVSVMMTIQNCDGTNDDPAGGYSHAPFAVHLPGGASAAGVCMARHRYTAPSGDPPVACDQGSMALAVLTLADADTGPACVTTCGLFSTNVAVDGLTSASNLWSAFEVNGDLTHCTASGTVGAGVAAASAVCKKIKINKQSHANFTFSLSWDHPMARFGGGKTLPKYYTRFFGRSGLASPSICAYSLLHFQRWRREIIDWQHPVNSDESLPAYYRHMLFNELYFLVDGGSIWLDSTDGVENTDSPLPPSCFQSDVLPEKCPCSFASLKAAVERQRDVVLDLADRSLWSGHDEAVRACVGNSEVVGQFLYLEGHEYLMYNTYDVHFYAGFALLMLFPQLELSLQRDFARAVPAEDPILRTMLGEGGKRPRKVAGCIPHDLGSPSEEPFAKTNIYNFQDVSMWKDLPSKFVLQIFRNYKYTLATRFLTDMYHVVIRVMEQALLFDKDGDGMIENEGFPDQTYDIWTATGVHAYCGGLWVAACFATAQMAKIMDDIPNYIKYTEIGDSARHVYQQKLWNGVYFDYDSSNSGHHDSIMADMLAGQWYCRVCSLPPIASVAQAVSCFRTIYKYNVLGNRDDGLIGAINGMRPNGSIDTSCLQSREVWTGTTYALASAMLLEANILELSMSLDPKTIEVDISNTQSKNYTNDIEETNALVDADLDFRFDETLNIGFGEDNRRGKMRKSRLKNPFKVFGKNKVTEPKALTILEELSSPRGRTSICAELRRMGYATAQGIHDAGWQRYGYWFATPEGWETSGNYRSLGYMRPLAIWAMHYAGDKNSGPVL